MPYARTDDRVGLYSETHGLTGSGPSGAPLVLAHGVGGNTDMWDTNTPALAVHHRVILGKPRGRRGRPPRPADARRRA